jgi:hypothetical protein
MAGRGVNDKQMKYINIVIEFITTFSGACGLPEKCMTGKRADGSFIILLER